MSYRFFTVRSADPLRDKEYLLGLGPDVCFFDLDKIICELQVRSALDRVERVRTQDRMISNSFGIELILELAGYPQINKSLRILEITTETKRIGVITKDVKLDITCTEGLEITPNTLHEEYGLSPGNVCNKIIARAATMRA